jgi:hypothetical protein
MVVLNYKCFYIINCKSKGMDNCLKRVMDR